MDQAGDRNLIKVEERRVFGGLRLLARLGPFRGRMGGCLSEDSLLWLLPIRSVCIRVTLNLIDLDCESLVLGLGFFFIDGAICLVVYAGPCTRLCTGLCTGLTTGLCTGLCTGLTTGLFTGLCTGLCNRLQDVRIGTDYLYFRCTLFLFSTLLGALQGMSPTRVL